MTTVPTPSAELEELCSDITNYVRSRVSQYTVEYPQQNQSNGNHTPTNLQPIEKSTYRRKQFVMRESTLTVLFRTSSLSSIYNFFLAILILVVLDTCVLDILNDGRINLSFELIWWCFGKFHIAMTLWTAMFLSTIMIAYPIFRNWAERPMPFFHNEKFDNYVISGMYITYLLLFFFWPAYFIIKFDLPTASAYIVNCEQIRFMMKLHSFIRENVPNVLAYKAKLKHKSDDVSAASPPCPAFEKFLYFLFAPTLLYRDEYPRTKKTNWNTVAKLFAQCLGCILYTYYIYSRFGAPLFQKFSNKEKTMQSYALTIFACILPGSMCLLLLFWGLLHCWLNMFAEMLTFGDRLFYTEWWNSTTMAQYYREWNLVIHEWLYYYIYRDFSQLNFAGRIGGKKLGVMLVFLVSAFTHEYMFITGIRVFYPVIFLLYFVFGGTFFFVSRIVQMDQGWNVIMWFNLLIGNGLFMALYGFECKTIETTSYQGRGLLVNKCSEDNSPTGMQFFIFPPETAGIGDNLSVTSICIDCRND